MTDFKIKFRGVRGSFPVADKNFLQYGGNTSCTEVTVGGQTIILDAGTGIVNVGDELVKKYISSSMNIEERTPINATILLSHIHQDHLQGLTFFKPMHIKSTKLEIFGFGNETSDLSENLSALIFGKTFPLDLDDIACDCNIHNIYDKQAIIIKKGENTPKLVNKNDLTYEKEDIIITFYKSYVHPQEGVMIYKISYKDKSLVYATDKECYFGGDKQFIKFAQNCDVLIHDAQYTSEDYLNIYFPKQGYGHSTYDMAVETFIQTRAKNLIFYHYDPSYNDKKLDRIKELYTTGKKNIYMSYEGLEFEIE